MYKYKSVVMNSYNIYEEEHYSTILYHAIARDEERVRELASEAGISLDGMTIEIERSNVKDMLDRPFSEYIEEAIVR